MWCWSCNLSPESRYDWNTVKATWNPISIKSRLGLCDRSDFFLIPPDRGWGGYIKTLCHTRSGQIFKRLFLLSQLMDFNQTWHKCFLGGHLIFQNESHSFGLLHNYVTGAKNSVKKVKSLKISSKTFDTMYHHLMGLYQVCSNYEPRTKIAPPRSWSV